MEEEIIAKRQTGIVLSNILVLVILAAFAVASFWAFGEIGRMAIIFVCIVCAVAVVAAVFAVRALVRLSRIPKVIAVRDGDTLVFLGERVRLSAIEDVRYRHARGRYGMQSWGKLTIFLKDGGTLGCDYVANVDRVQDRLIALKYEYAAKEE